MVGGHSGGLGSLGKEWILDPAVRLHPTPLYLAHMVLIWAAVEGLDLHILGCLWLSMPR